MVDFMESSPVGDNNIHSINSNGTDGRGIFRGDLDFVTDYDPASPETCNPAMLEKGTNSQTELEKGQQEVENSKKEQSSEEHSDNDRESETKAYSFSEDQKRAMEELMMQTQEDDDLPGEDPPEYNVKDTLIQLNAVLASVPMPVEAEREHKVVFKPTIVDLVASPPPDYSDDELQPCHNNQESESSVDASISSNQKNNSSNEQTVTAEHQDKLADSQRQQFVVEREGKFSVVAANDLTSAEQDMLLDEEDNKKKAEKQIQNEKTKNEHNTQENLVFSRSVTGFMTPQPPSRSRPKSVATSSRRSSHQAQSPQRRSSHQAQSPQRRSTNQVINSTSSLNNFAYTSPYAMSCEEKAAAREQARRLENERKEIELQKRQEDEEKRIENENAFQAWLNRKMEEEKQKRDSEMKIENLEQEKRDRSEDPFKAWKKVKKTQVKRERLLKRRQQEEKTDGFYLRSREECDEAFKEWLKKKNAEVKKQQVMERQNNKLYRIQVKASRRTLALIRALKEAQAYGYFDLHSCTF